MKSLEPGKHVEPKRRGTAETTEATHSRQTPKHFPKMSSCPCEDGEKLHSLAPPVVVALVELTREILRQLFLKIGISQQGLAEPLEIPELRHLGVGFEIQF